MSDFPMSDAIANSWEDYRETIQKAMEGELDPQAIEFARASFYFGSLATLSVLEAISDNGTTIAVSVALQGLRQEVEGFISGQATPLN